MPGGYAATLVAMMAAIMCWFWAPPAWSAAWTLPQGTGQAIFSTTYYRVEDRFDEDGDRAGQPRFSKLEIAGYVQYGITNDVTAGINPRLHYLEADSGNGEDTSTGLAATDFFIRARLWHDPSSVVSLQGLVKAPNTDNTAEPALGFGQTDVELRLLLGHSGGLGKASYFTNIEAGFRKRFEAPADEARVDATLGLRPAGRWLLMLQSFNTVGLGNASGAKIVQTSGLDADRYQLQASVVRELTAALSLQIGVLRDVAGRNSGAGTAGVMGLWVRF